MGAFGRLLSARQPRFLLSAAAIVIIIAGLRAAQEPLVTLMLASLLAILSMPLVTWLQRHRIPMVIAVLCAVLIDLVILAAFAALLAIGVKEMLAVPEKYEASIARLIERATPLFAKMGLDLTNISLRELMGDGAVAGMVGGTLHGLAAIFMTLVFVLLTMAFILSEATGFREKLRAAFNLPDASLERLAHITREIQRYLGIKTGLAIAISTMFGTWLALVGVDYPLLWSLLTFALYYIPNIGSLIATIGPLTLAALQLGPGSAALVALGGVFVHTIFGNIAEPALMGRQLGLSALVVFLSLIFWGWVWGPIGMVLAVPLTMSFKISLEQSPEYRWLAVLLDPSLKVRKPPAQSRRRRLMGSAS